MKAHCLHRAGRLLALGATWSCSRLAAAGPIDPPQGGGVPVWWWCSAAGAALLGVGAFGWRSWRRPRRETAADRHWREILAMTDSMVWEAEVCQAGDKMLWDFKLLQPSQLYRRLFGTGLPGPSGALWGGLPVLEQAEMDERSRGAILSGKSGYEQDFRVCAEGRTFWLHEAAAIERTGPGRWHVVAVVTDVTTRREAEDERRRSDQRLERLAAEVHAMIWQARVLRRPDGELQWEIFLPGSELYRRLFRGEPDARPTLFWASIGVPEVPEMTLRAREAILAGHAGYEQEFHVPGPGGDIWLREQVAIRPNGADEWALNGVVVDISLRRQAEAKRREEEALLQQLLSAANCLLWRGTARRLEDGSLYWEAVTSRSVLYQQIFGDPPAGTPCLLDWHRVVVPENAEIDARARAAVLEGRPGYAQDFRVLLPGRVLWLHEQVTIAAAGPEVWSLAGVIVDISARREAEEAYRTYQLQLAQILGAVDCLLWRARVIDRGDERLHWSVFIAPSRLHTAIFGAERSREQYFHWERVTDAATDARLDRVSTEAIRTGKDGYVQEFRVRCADRERWLREQVVIDPVGPGEWNLVGVITDETPRHDVEAAERDHQRQLERIFDVVDCLLWRADVVQERDGSFNWLVFVPSSNLYHKLFGAAPPDPRTALNWNEASVPEYPEMQRRSAEALRTGVAGYEQEFRAYVGGRMYWLFERATIRRTAFNRWELVGVVVDVTATRTAEQEVRQSEQRYRTLFQHTPVAMVEMNFVAVGQWLQQLRTEGVSDIGDYLAGERRRVWRGASLVEVIDCNDMALQVLGAGSREELWRKRRWLLAPETLGVVREVFAAVAQGRDAFEGETRIRDLHGRSRQVLLRWWIGHGAGGLDLQRAVMVLVDLTKLKRAEAELAGEKERLAVTLRAMAEGVITTDTESRVQFINPAAAALTHWDPAAAVGRPVVEICALRAAGSDTPLSLPLAPVLRGDQVGELPPHAELLTRTGERRLVEGRCAPIHAADSSVVGAVLVLRDVTERERLEQEILRASKLESVGLLAGGIAHDFNNILTAVMGNLALAQLDVDAESELGRTVRDAERAALRARDLTQQLLTFARGGEPIRAAVRLPEVVAEVTRFALHGSKVRAEFALAADLWPADVDKAQIGRVVQNLVINAVQAMPGGGVVRIAAGNERLAEGQQPPLGAGAYVCISVSDTGTGIKPEHLERVFEPYFTTKQTGTGLGLATVYSIVRKHKGHVAVESALGRGTTFHVHLPAAEHVQPAPEATVVTAAHPLRGRVLFMDDEAAIRSMATMLLQRLGCEVDATADGQAAVERFRSERAAGRAYDVVVMDLTVPGGMGGLEALERIREIDSGVRAIVSSGYSSDPVLANFRHYGFSGRVAKPYEIAEFGRVLREVLGGP